MVRGECRCAVKKEIGGGEGASMGWVAMLAVLVWWKQIGACSGTQPSEIVPPRNLKIGKGVGWGVSSIKHKKGGGKRGRWGKERGGGWILVCAIVVDEKVLVGVVVHCERAESWVCSICRFLINFCVWAPIRSSYSDW